jgi:hypothetical protein
MKIEVIISPFISPTAEIAAVWVGRSWMQRWVEWSDEQKSLQTCVWIYVEGANEKDERERETEIKLFYVQQRQWQNFASFLIKIAKIMLLVSGWCYVLWVCVCVCVCEWMEGCKMMMLSFR